MCVNHSLASLFHNSRQTACKSLCLPSPVTPSFRSLHRTAKAVANNACLCARGSEQQIQGQKFTTHIRIFMQVCNFITDDTTADVVMRALDARRKKAYSVQPALEGLLRLLAPTQDLNLSRHVLRKLAHAHVCTISATTMFFELLVFLFVYCVCEFVHMCMHADTNILNRQIHRCMQF
jgi:hypothetical protein